MARRRHEEMEVERELPGSVLAVVGAEVAGSQDRLHPVVAEPPLQVAIAQANIELGVAEEAIEPAAVVHVRIPQEVALAVTVERGGAPEAKQAVLGVQPVEILD